MARRNDGPALLHVRGWDPKYGWIPITIEKACQLYESSVSAESGLLCCWLCGKNVLLARGEIKTPHFRHSSNDQDKNCEDRVQRYGYNGLLEKRYSFQRNATATLRLDDAKDSLFCSIELRALPDKLYDNVRNKKLSITTSEGVKKVFSLSDYLSRNTPVYIERLPLASTYCFSFEDDEFDGELAAYWPKEVKVGDYAFFDAETKKLIPNDGNIVVDRYYLFLARKTYSIFDNGGFSKDETRTYEQGKWKLFSFKVWDFNLYLYNYLNESFHRRLSRLPALFYPMWPPCFSDGDSVKHGETETYMFYQGDYKFKTFPDQQTVLIDSSEEFSPRDKWVMKLRCVRGIWALGCEEIVRQIYFNKVDLFGLATQETPVVRLSTKGFDLTKDSYSTEPPKRIKVEAKWDGVIVTKEDDRIVRKEKLSANKVTVLKPQRGQSFYFYQGLDLVRKLTFEVATPKVLVQEIDQVNLLQGNAEQSDNQLEANCVEPSKEATQKTDDSLEQGNEEQTEEQLAVDEVAASKEEEQDLDRDDLLRENLGQCSGQMAYDETASPEVETTNFEDCFGKGRELEQSVEQSTDNEFTFPRVGASKTEEDFLLRRKLERCFGRLQFVPHTYAHLASELEDYPLVKEWLFKAIRKTKAPQDALSLIKFFLLNGSIKY